MSSLTLFPSNQILIPERFGTVDGSILGATLLGRTCLYSECPTVEAEAGIQIVSRLVTQCPFLSSAFSSMALAIDLPPVTGLVPDMTPLQCLLMYGTGPQCWCTVWF